MLEGTEALVHFGFGGLRAVATECAACGVAVGGLVGDVGGEVRARRRIDLHAVPARRGGGAIGGKADVEESCASGRGAGLEDLRDDVADEAMILMTIAAFRAPGEHD